MRAVVFAYSNVGDRCLRVLHAGGVDVPLVVTHRDRPGEVLWFDRVADTAAELGLQVAYAEDLAGAALAAAVGAARPDFIFSFYFRSLLAPEVLGLAAAGAFNMHGSLLPQFRGRAPTNWAVLTGATETGATLHEMVARADAGPIVDQSAVPILPDDTARQVYDKVTVAAEQVLWRSLPGLLAGSAPRRPNDIARGSVYPGRRPEDGRIDFTRPAAEVYNLVRAVAPPYPGAYAEIAGRRLVIAQARRRHDDAAAAVPAACGLHAAGGGIVARCGDGGLIDVRELLCDGRRVDAAALAGLMHGSLPTRTAA